MKFLWIHRHGVTLGSDLDVISIIVVMGHSIGCEETIHGNILVRDISKWTEKRSEMYGFMGEV